MVAWTAHPSVELPTPEEALSRTMVRPRFPVLAVVILLGATVGAGLLMAPATGGLAQVMQRTIALLVPLGALAYAMFWSAQMAAEFRREAREVRAASEAESLGRQQEVELLLCKLLSGPMLSPLHRVDVLWLYIAALHKRGRFADVCVTAERMLAEGVPASMVAALRGARAHALLREDQLVDADRALTELRREDVAGDGVAETLYRLLGMLRDVSNGHPEEALSTYREYRDTSLALMGSRASSADALAAAAAHALGRREEAQAYWYRATVLESAGELVAKYPVVRGVSEAYEATPVPAEVAAAFGGGVSAEAAGGRSW